MFSLQLPIFSVGDFASNQESEEAHPDIQRIDLTGSQDCMGKIGLEETRFFYSPNQQSLTANRKLC